MVRFLSRWLGDRQLAEAETQEAFDILLSRWDERSEHPNLPGWLWKIAEGMPRDRHPDGQSAPEMDLLANELRQLSERDFRLELVEERLDGPRFDVVKALGALHWRHAEFFDERPPTALAAAEPAPPEEEEPDTPVPAAPRELRTRLARAMRPVRTAWLYRAARLAAAVLVLGGLAWGAVALLAGQGRWEEKDGLLTGAFESFSQALTVNGVTLPMAPTLIPPPGEHFGELSMTCTADRFEGYDLFTARYLDENGKGYYVKITRPDYPAVTDPAGASVEGAKEYVCDGIAYYVIPNGTGTYHVSWGRGGLSGYIDGNLDLDTAMALARSITRTPEGRTPGTPERSPVLVYDSLARTLAANRLDLKLAPAWLPGDLETVDRFVTGAGYGTDVTMVHSEYQGDGERMLALQLEWWEEPSRPTPPAFQWEGSAYHTEIRGGVEYTLLSDGYAQVVAWRKGHVSGWLYGTLGEDELWKIVDSIPQWESERPESAGSADALPQTWTTLNRAVDALGLDTDLIPTWLPDGYRVQEVTSDHTGGTLKIDAVYRKDDLTLGVGFLRYDSEEAAARSTIGKDTLVPTVLREHNGFTYYIVGFGDFYTIRWRDGMLEGYISGTLVNSQVNQIIDSIPAKLDS